MVECVYPDARAARGDSPGAARSLRPSPHSQNRGSEEASPSTSVGGASESTSDPAPAPTQAYQFPSDQLPWTAGYPSQQSILPAEDDDDGVLDLPESRERRLLELRLLHNYVIAQATAMDRPLYPPEALDPETQYTQFHWGIEIIELAFEDDTVLYAILAQSALSKWAMAGSDTHEREEWFQLQRRYLALALREQRRAVGQLSVVNADRVCCASLMLLSHLFALVQTVPVDPWQPPVEWLQMGKGTGQVLMVARGRLTANGPENRLTRFMNSPPHFIPEKMFNLENREPLMWLLEAPVAARSSDSIEMQDTVTQNYYNHLLSYIGWTKRAIDAGEEPMFWTIRRFAAFSAWAPDMLGDFLEQRRPRAMVVLAYFFALWMPYERVWMVGKTGANQVRAIYAALQPEWREKLDPLMDKHNLR